MTFSLFWLEHFQTVLETYSNSEAAVLKCSSKYVFLNFSQYSQEDTCAVVSF